MNQAEPEGGQRCAKTGGKAFGLPYHELLEFMGRFSYNFARHPEEQRYNESLPTLPMNQAEPASRQRCTKAGDKAFGLPYNDLVDFMATFSYNFDREISAKVCVVTTNYSWDFLWCWWWPRSCCRIGVTLHQVSCALPIPNPKP